MTIFFLDVIIFLMERVCRQLKIFFFILLFIFPNFSLFPDDFPEHISKQAIISIFSVSYTDLEHSLFSKNCLRIYDKNSNFDKIIDFAYFENFDDKFFILKFFFNPKKAFIKSENFIDFFLEHSQKKNVILTESILQLNSEEVDYIFNFISLMNKALPDYSYDFNLIENNSETHISQILHDCNRMTGEKQSQHNYSFSEIKRHDTRFIRTNDSFLKISSTNPINLTKDDFSLILKQENFSAFIFLIVISGLFFCVTLYQLISYFIQSLKVNSVFWSIQIIDFLILFISGFAGCMILYQNLFSNHSLFQYNIQILFLFPAHVIGAFIIFFKNISNKLKIFYWLISSLALITYLIVLLVVQHQLTLLHFLFVLPLFFRILYFELIEIFNYLRLHNSRSISNC